MIFGFGQKILVGHPGVLTDVFVELVRIGNARLALQVRHVLGDFRVDVDVQLFGFLNQQQLVDPLRQNILVPFGNLIFQRCSGHTLLPQILPHLPSRALQFILGDDVAIHLGHDLIDNLYIGRKGASA